MEWREQSCRQDAFAPRYTFAQIAGGITMLRRCRWLLVFVSVCFFVSGICVAQNAEEDNLVQNYDFEDATFAPWTMWVEDGSIKGSTIMEVDDKDSFTGDQSLSIDISKKGSGQRVELHQNPFTLKMGDKLTYAFWAKVEEGEVREAGMRCNHRADPWTTYGSSNITITEEWTEFYTTVNITVDDSVVGIYVELRDTEGITWFDRFRFYEGDYEPEDLEEAPDIAVKPHSKMASMWASIKSAR